MLASLLFTAAAIVLLKRARVSAGWTVATLALVPLVALMALAAVAPGYLPSLLAAESGSAAIASSVGTEILAALWLTWAIRRKV
ncbi:MAG TPA: hypothetical protein VMB03_33505 [Bryobacteraceae bacterium]|nr:hypothetical protein [Bryobacteraceae bacterium]